MSGGVLHFRPSTLSYIPTPLCARPGDSFTQFDVLDDSMGIVGIYAGAALITLESTFIDGSPHVVQFSDEDTAGILTHIAGDMVYFDDWRGESSGEYRLTELASVSLIVDIYPKGLGGPRLSLTFDTAKVQVNKTGPIRRYCG